MKLKSKAMKNVQGSQQARSKGVSIQTTSSVSVGLTIVTNYEFLERWIDDSVTRVEAAAETGNGDVPNLPTVLRY
jgi:LEA14-like dessication related protein